MKYSEYACLCNELYKDASQGRVTVDDLAFSVTRNPDQTIITPRGSWNIENWLRDFDCRIITNKHGRRIHAGFEGAFNKIWPVLVPMLPKQGKIVPNGHSLGGFIAVRIAEELGCDPITFGCPMGYAMGYEAPAMNHTRIICDDDPIPTWPPLGFSHYCKPTIVLQSPGEWLNPEDHKIGVYIDRLTARGL